MVSFLLLQITKVIKLYICAFINLTKTFLIKYHLNIISKVCCFQDVMSIICENLIEKSKRKIYQPTLFF